MNNKYPSEYILKFYLRGEKKRASMKSSLTQLYEITLFVTILGVRYSFRRMRALISQQHTIFHDIFPLVTIYGKWETIISAQKKKEVQCTVRLLSKYVLTL